nr:hypothetical protein [Tanacetum cinerariifolium]
VFEGHRIYHRYWIDSCLGCNYSVRLNANYRHLSLDRDYDHGSFRAFLSYEAKHRLEIHFHVERKLGFLRGVGRKRAGEESENESDSEEFVNVFMRNVLVLPSNWFPLTRVKWFPLIANSFAVSGIVIAESRVGATTQSAAHIASTSMETQNPLLKDKDGEEVDVHMYMSMIGSLMYLTSSRLDIMFVVCACARYQVNPKVSYLNAEKMIFSYLKGQPKLGLWYPEDSPFYLVAYTDSDYAEKIFDVMGCEDAFKTRLAVFKFEGNAMAWWKAYKQAKGGDVCEDLEDLYKLVKVRYGSTRPVENIDYLLWSDMKIMFEPHVEDEIYMLVEKKYPLTPPTLLMMLEKKLQIDYKSEMAYQLCKLIKKQLKNYKSVWKHPPGDGEAFNEET